MGNCETPPPRTGPQIDFFEVGLAAPAGATEPTATTSATTTQTRTRRAPDRGRNKASSYASAYIGVLYCLPMLSSGGTDRTELAVGLERRVARLTQLLRGQ